MVLPEAFARDFGDPSHPLGPYAEALDGPFARAVDTLAQRWGTTVVAGMFETSDDPERPFNTLLVRGAVEAAYRKIHLYDSFGFRESDRLVAGELTPQVVELRGVKLGLMTCYDLRFPELARRLVDRGPRPSSSPRPGWPATGRSTTGAPSCGRVPSRTPCT
ncbi:hypothetical protein LP418_09975 [Nocardioides sp. B-3]|nr:nitrilase-related carbon-nitrogen hydrolase [Nocardioides sp. B-3]UUZ60977.1 hypothetical protein LP418_09975 [Nocardioides sp. B-3]